jgi:hypothetical protein
MEKKYYRLHTKLSVNECLNRLEEQVDLVTSFTGGQIFFQRTSRVIGQLKEKEFIVAAAHDPHSKRMKGRLVEKPSGTDIEYEWVMPFWSHIWGSYKYDEEEILRFFRKWLEAKPVAQNGNKKQRIKK